MGGKDIVSEVFDEGLDDVPLQESNDFEGFARAVRGLHADARSTCH